MQVDMEERAKELIKEKFRDRERGGRRYLLERAINVSKTLGIRAHLLLQCLVFKEKRNQCVTPPFFDDHPNSMRVRE